MGSTAVRSSWEEGPKSALQGAALGLLVGRSEPIHAYMLGTLLDRHLGPAWRIDHKAIYGVLHALERERLVRSVALPQDFSGRGASGPSPTRGYLATELAEQVLREWMAAPASGLTHRGELEARIACSRECDIPLLQRALDEYERDCMRMLSRSQPQNRVASWAAVRLNLTRKRDDVLLQAELQWIEHARTLIAEFEVGR